MSACVSAGGARPTADLRANGGVQRSAAAGVLQIDGCACILHQHFEAPRRPVRHRIVQGRALLGVACAGIRASLVTHSHISMSHVQGEPGSA